MENPEFWWYKFGFQEDTQKMNHAGLFSVSNHIEIKAAALLLRSFTVTYWVDDDLHVPPQRSGYRQELCSSNSFNLCLVQNAIDVQLWPRIFFFTQSPGSWPPYDVRKKRAQRVALADLVW
ncbi:hypothetical protein T09_10304 [Trichinella sp. T9]|nr:hypothetical protein T09_10304 [Trichinella sp. T9]